MFFAMIEAPASPNPKARSAPILVSCDSKIYVSIGASPSFINFNFSST